MPAPDGARKLFLRIPIVDTCDRELTRWLTWFARTPEGADADIDLHLGNLGTTENRNQICELFLRSDCTHLWMIDSDVAPPRHLGLLEKDEPCINGIYQHFAVPNLTWDVWMELPNQKFAPIPPRRWPADRWWACDSVGGGCMVLQRQLLEALEPPWFTIDYYDPPSHMHPIGEDFMFCRRLRQEGHKIWVDTHYRCHHIKSVSLVMAEQLIGGKR